MRRKAKKKKERKKKRKTVYYAIYVGKHKHITYTGIKERIIPGKEYLVEEKLAEALTTSKNWKVRKSYSYTDIK